MFLKSEVGPVGWGSVQPLLSLLDSTASLLGWIVAVVVGAYAHAWEQ